VKYAALKLDQQQARAAAQQPAQAAAGGMGTCFISIKKKIKEKNYKC
jgi:hypothetical protein